MSSKVSLVLALVALYVSGRALVAGSGPRLHLKHDWLGCCPAAGDFGGFLPFWLEL